MAGFSQTGIIPIYIMKPHFILTSVVAFFALTSPAFSKFMSPEMIPVERLLKSAEAYVVANPNSEEAKYILARIHYLAFARSSGEVPAFNEADTEGKPEIAPNWMIRGMKPSDELNEAQLTAHANDAITGFQKLIEKDSDNGLYQLGFASLIEQIIEWREKAKPKELPEQLKNLTLKQAQEAYLVAYRASFGKDSKLKYQPTPGISSLVSYEAGTAFVRLAESEGETDKDLKAALKEVKEGLKKIEALPMGAITPIIFSMLTVDSIEDLLTPETKVDFNLRGYGPRERTTWVKPETAFLVWDPAKEGDITTGEQLFGGYTFRIFRETGYHALAALDDDANGILQGAELEGVCAWFDLGSDGKSSASEVRDLADLGIVGIKVIQTGTDGSHPTCHDGLMLKDGTTLPTWDWMAEPLK